MKKTRIVFMGIIAAAGITVSALVSMGLFSTELLEEKSGEQPTNNNAVQSFPLIQTIPLPNVQGRIDHMDIDLKGQRLFVAELESNSVGIIDLRTSSVIHTITSLHEPQGVLYAPFVNEIFVANGGDGTVQIFDGSSFGLIKTISLSSDADNMRYNASTRLVYVGYGSGAIGIIDPSTNKVIGNMPLSGHPESFQITTELSPNLIFVNVPNDDSIEIINSQNNTVSDKWSNDGDHGNYPMALDEDFHRLFVGYRDPPQLSVIDTSSGKTMATVDIPKDPDDIFYDASTRQIYVSGGDGFDYIISVSGENYKIIDKIPTGIGARTSLLVQQTGILYVAVPSYSIPQAQILVYKIH